MNKRHNQIFIKKCQFILVFTILISFSGNIESSTRRKNFVCAYNHVAEYINSLITMDRQVTLNYIASFHLGAITEDELVDLTATLIRYRFFPINSTGKCRFFNYLCITPSTEKDTIYELALQAVQTRSSDLGHCYISSGANYEKHSLFGETCRNAIKKRIRPIPPPLILSQAGWESGWGTSFFSIEGNNFFGIQTVFSSSSTTRRNPRCIPARNNPKRCVYNFNSVETGFFIYSQVLNSARSYIQLRNHRYESELRGDTLCNISLQMARGLNRYAEDPNYVQKIQNTIRTVCQIINNCYKM